MDEPKVYLRFAAELRSFLAPRNRHGQVAVAHDGTSSLGHLIQSLGLPIPEIGALVADGRDVAHSHRPTAGETVSIEAPQRPQELPITPPRFLLDVHLGKLARRLRLIGVDTAYDNDRDDPALVVQANAERRVLLTQDRGLLCRRNLWLGAHVRGTDPDEQLQDVLERFAPPLAPWTRCTNCNGELAPTGKDEVEHLLQPGTSRNYDNYGKCSECDRVYWRGAHSRQLEAIVEKATRTVSAHH